MAENPIRIMIPRRSTKQSKLGLLHRLTRWFVPNFIRAPKGRSESETTTDNFRFTALPLELKYKIAGYVLHQPGIVMVRAKAKETGNSSSIEVVTLNGATQHPVNLALVYVCRAFYRDFRPEFMSLNTFWFESLRAWQDFSMACPNVSLRSLLVTAGSVAGSEPLGVSMFTALKTWRHPPVQLQTLRRIELVYVVGRPTRRTRPADIRSTYSFGLSISDTLVALKYRFPSLQTASVTFDAVHNGPYDELRRRGIDDLLEKACVVICDDSRRILVERYGWEVSERRQIPMVGPTTLPSFLSVELFL